MGELGKLLRLSAPERADLLLAIVLLPWIALTLKRKGLRGARVTGPRFPATKSPADATAKALQVARMVSVAARHGPYRANCLVRSLTLERLLARAGVPAELRVGVRKVEDRLEAHAWVERDGVPLMEAGDVGESYAPFDSLTAARR